MKTYLLDAWKNTPKGGKAFFISFPISLFLMLVSGSFSEDVFSSLIATCLLALIFMLPVAFCCGLVERYINYRKYKADS